MTKANVVLMRRPSIVSAGASNSSKITPAAVRYLRMSLPNGWQSYFNCRRTGRSLGPEDSLSSLRRNGPGHSIAVAAMALARRSRVPAQVRGGNNNPQGVNGKPGQAHMSRYEHVAKMALSGMSSGEIARLFNITPATVRTYIARARSVGSEAPERSRSPMKGYDYAGNHWTQRPENKTRLSRMMQKKRRKKPLNAKQLRAMRHNAVLARAAHMRKAQGR